MPFEERLITEIDPITELSIHNRALLLTEEKPNDSYLVTESMAQSNLKNEKGKLTYNAEQQPKAKPRRQRSKTLPITEKLSTHVNESSRETKKAARLSKSLDSFPQESEAAKVPSLSVTPSGSRRRTLTAGNTGKDAISALSFSGGYGSSSNLSTSTLSTPDSNKLFNRRHTLVPSKLGPQNTSRPRKGSVLGSAGKSRAKSIPSSEKNSIYTILKARSLALKWYGGAAGKNSRRKQLSTLPKIDDSTKISLCKAKCSPQFEQVVKLLQGDTETIEDDLEILSLEP